MDEFYELAFLVKAGQRELDRRANEALRPLGLTGVQGDALTVLREAGPLSLKELGELLIAEAGHPSRLVDRLVEAGLVERGAAADDRRRVVLSLTRRGRAVEERVARARGELLDLARTLVAGRDLGPTIDLLRDLIQYSAYADLVERRRELAARSD